MRVFDKEVLWMSALIMAASEEYEDEFCREFFSYGMNIGMRLGGCEDVLKKGVETTESLDEKSGEDFIAQVDAIVEKIKAKRGGNNERNRERKRTEDA